MNKLPTDPLVSIIIPLYNAETYIAETIQSALNQTWANKEIIIIDDGSSDNSLAIARQFESDMVQVYQQKNQGASVARNLGLSKAKGQYIQFLDADDLLSADKIASQLQRLNGSLTHLALCQVVHFDDGADHLQSPPADKDWFCSDSDSPVDFLLKLNAGEEVMPGFGSMIQPNSWLTPRALIDKAGNWNNFRCPDDDGEFFCRVLLASEGIKYSAEGINYYRKHQSGNSLSAQRTLLAFENLLLAINSKYHNLKKKTADPIVEKIFARHYWELGVAAYPKYRYFSKKMIATAVKYGYKGKKYKAGPVSTLLSKLLGWRFARYLTYLRYKA